MNDRMNALEVMTLGYRLARAFLSFLLTLFTWKRESTNQNS